MIWIFTGGEGDEIESRLPFKTFSTLCIMTLQSPQSATIPRILTLGHPGTSCSEFYGDIKSPR